jgi:RND family efflux transporter MFP subunit
MHKHIGTGLLLLAMVVGIWPCRSLQAQPGAGPSPVIVCPVVSARQMDSRSFVGSLVPLRRSTIGSAVDGRVIQINVDEGDPVSGDGAGEPLVQLRTVLLDIEIEAAQVELKMREQAELELQASLPSEIAVAESVLEEIKARLQYSKSNYERLQGLLESGGGVAEQEVNQAFSTYRSQNQLAVGAETTLDRLVATRQSRLMQARSKVEAQDAEIRRLQELRDEYTIRAPFSGYITAKHTELGQWLSRGESVLEIIQVDPIELVIPVPQTCIAALQESLEKARSNNAKLVAQVSIDSLPRLLEGEVITSVPQADLRSRSFPVRIRIRNPMTPAGHLLKAGMLAQATLFLGDETDINLVKKDALVLGGLQKSLYVVSQDPKTQATVVRLVPVEVGACMEDWIQVIGDVKAGDQVVVEGNERLRPGQPVVVAKVLPDTLTIESDATDHSAGN